MSVFLIFLLFIVILIVLGISRTKEKYDEYDYALQNGKIVGGTVYASDVDNTPGLGWVL
jgi:Na+/proline symporter